MLILPRGSIIRGAHTVRARCRYWGCSVDPFSRFRGNCIHLGGPKRSQSACAPCFCFYDVFCHVPLFLGLLVAKFYCETESPYLNRAMSLSWLHALVVSHLHPLDWQECGSDSARSLCGGWLIAHSDDTKGPCPRRSKEGWSVQFSLREYVSALGMRRAHRAKFSHALVWPFELGIRTPTLRCGHLRGRSRTRGGFFHFEVGGHDGAYKGSVHVIVPFVERKNGQLFDCQKLYNVLVLRVPGLEKGVMLGGKAL